MLLQSTAMTATQKDLPTADPAPTFTGAAVGVGNSNSTSFVGAIVAPDGEAVGEMVVFEIVGDAVGERVVGLAVGSGVSKAVQVSAVLVV